MRKYKYVSLVTRAIFQGLSGLPLRYHHQLCNHYPCSHAIYPFECHFLILDPKVVCYSLYPVRFVFPTKYLNFVSNECSVGFFQFGSVATFSLRRGSLLIFPAALLSTVAFDHSGSECHLISNISPQLLVARFRIVPVVSASNIRTKSNHTSLHPYYRWATPVLHVPPESENANSPPWLDMLAFTNCVRNSSAGVFHSNKGGWQSDPGVFEALNSLSQTLSVAPHLQPFVKCLQKFPSSIASLKYLHSRILNAARLFMLQLSDQSKLPSR